ncbi:MAG TPA: D-amino acid aminotransferase [Longimicrobiales bacterium]|nr:D-amino acid aminotransferase [Longimicrobiales bacterium]
MLVYLNGKFVPPEEAKVSVTDRGFLLADGVYEVARVYAGEPYLMAEHLERMANGLKALKIREPDLQEIEDAARRLIRENGVDGDGTVYIQVTRGAAPRKHAFPPADTPPTVYVAANPYKDHPASYFTEGVAAYLAPDNRWGRCDIKSIALLPNVMANEAAHAAGGFEALFVKDGVVLEGSHSNLWGVRDGRLITYPASNYILPGITRARVFELAGELGIPAEEGMIFQHELYEFDELFLSGTTTEVMPVVKVDDRPIGDGKPGPVAKRLQEAYRAAASSASS